MGPKYFVPSSAVDGYDEALPPLGPGAAGRALPGLTPGQSSASRKEQSTPNPLLGIKCRIHAEQIKQRREELKNTYRRSFRSVTKRLSGDLLVFMVFPSSFYWTFFFFFSTYVPPESAVLTWYPLGTVKS